MKFAVIAAALPPQLDGIGDYTSLLAAELGKSQIVTVYTSQGFLPLPIPGVAIRQVFSAEQSGSVRALLPAIKADAPDWVVLQYNPFSYGRWGLNLTLPNVIRRITRCLPEVKFALMMHEPFVPANSVRLAVMTLWQRWQLWQLGCAADLMLCSIDPWAQRFSHWFLKTPVRHLAVGSNIPCVPMTRAEARERLGIAEETLVLGVFGSAHPSRMLNRVRGAAEAVRASGQNVLVLYMGPHSAVVCRELGNIPTLAEGPLSGEEISRRFAAVDIALTPFSDGISTRRGSLMTSLQHGVATVGTQGISTDAILVQQSGKSLLLADVKSQSDFDAHVLRLAVDETLRGNLGQEAQRLYCREFSWSQIAAKMTAMMEKVRP